MAKKRIYLDSGVLIAAFQGNGEISTKALEILDDPDIELVISDYLKLEVLPKPTYLKRHLEVEFMDMIFNAAAFSVTSDASLTNHAVSMASKYDLTAVDALHISCAVHSSVDEFVTVEGPTKPMFRVTELPVIRSLR